MMKEITQLSVDSSLTMIFSKILNILTVKTNQLKADLISFIICLWNNCLFVACLFVLWLSIKKKSFLHLSFEAFVYFDLYSAAVKCPLFNVLFFFFRKCPRWTFWSHRHFGECKLQGNGCRLKLLSLTRCGYKKVSHWTSFVTKGSSIGWERGKEKKRKEKRRPVFGFQLGNKISLCSVRIQVVVKLCWTPWLQPFNILVQNKSVILQ